MWYMGGKHRQSKMISQIIGEREGYGFQYWEPFCGAMWSAVRIIKDLHPSVVILSDLNQPLIAMWNALVRGELVLPSKITDAEYTRYKSEMNMEDPLTAWYGFGTSFGGKWFGGMARHTREKLESYDFSGQVRSTMQKVGVLRGCNNLTIIEAEFFQLLDFAPSGFVIYCDPPYEGRTKAHPGESFDYPGFWNGVRSLSLDNSVYTTCFDCPDDFEILYDWGCTIVNQSGMKHEVKHGNITEKLVIYKGRN